MGFFLKHLLEDFLILYYFVIKLSDFLLVLWIRNHLIRYRKSI